MKEITEAIENYQNNWQPNHPMLTESEKKKLRKVFKSELIELLSLVAEKQRNACANDIGEESQDDPLIFAQTEAIRTIVGSTPLITEQLKI